jgi:hypothetical protein
MPEIGIDSTPIHRNTSNVGFTTICLSYLPNPPFLSNIEDIYITTHQHDSSQPQQSHSSPHEVLIGEGLRIEVKEAVVLVEGIVGGGIGSIVERRYPEIKV